MKPQVAYLIDENQGWDNDPDWRFYCEKDVPQWKIEHANKKACKRIVYWEIDDDQ